MKKRKNIKVYPTSGRYRKTTRDFGYDKTIQKKVEAILKINRDNKTNKSNDTNEMIERYKKVFDELKDKSFKELNKEGIKLNPDEDTDGDGVINKDDCRPLDKKRHMVFAEKTTVPIVDSPESFGYETEKKEISPNEFMELSRKEALERTKGEEGYEYVETPERYEEVVIDKSNLKRIKEGLKSSEPLVPPGYIEFGEEGEPIAHEGRHRAIAAREIGMKKIPVYFLKKKK